MIDDPKQFPDAVALGAAMPLSLRPFQTIVFLEHFVVLDDGKYDLAQSLPEIFGAFLGNGGVFGPILARLAFVGRHAGEFYDLGGVLVVAYVS